MHTPHLLLPLSTSLSTNQPRAPTYHGISLWFITTTPTQPYTNSPSPAEINVLTRTPGASASSIAFDTVSANVDYRKVECRAFEDADGVVPLGGGFNWKTPLVLSKEGAVGVGSYLCYVVGDEEAAGF